MRELQQARPFELAVHKYPVKRLLISVVVNPYVHNGTDAGAAGYEMICHVAEHADIGTLSGKLRHLADWNVSRAERGRMICWAIRLIGRTESRCILPAGIKTRA